MLKLLFARRTLPTYVPHEVSNNQSDAPSNSSATSGVQTDVTYFTPASPCPAHLDRLILR